MQLALRPYAMSGVAVAGAGLIAITPVTPAPADLEIHSPAVQLAAAVDLGDFAGLVNAADPAGSIGSSLGGLIDSGLQHVENFVLDGGIALGYAEYGLLTEVANGLDALGATTLGADVTTLANDAINTQWTAGVTSDFNGLIALVNEIFGVTSADSAGAAASVAADVSATSLGGLIDAGLQHLETSIDDTVTTLGYAAYGLLSELSTGLDDFGATSLGADVLLLANDAIDTQFTVAPINDFFSALMTLVNDLGLNSIGLGAGDVAAAAAADVAPNLADIVSTLF